MIYGDLRDAATFEEWQMSDGEIHFLYWFIQGSIMNPDTRWRLRHAWGMCERHAWGALAVEAAFRHSFLHGPALLYQDLMERALQCFPKRGPLKAKRLGWNLRAVGPCLMCESGLNKASRGLAREELLRQGRDIGEFRRFALSTKAHWMAFVCGRCSGADSQWRCRPHLLDDISRGVCVDAARYLWLVEHICEHLTAYARSFTWGYHDTDTAEDRAALIAAIGWCSGWRPVLAVVSLG